MRKFISSLFAKKAANNHHHVYSHHKAALKAKQAAAQPAEFNYYNQLLADSDSDLHFANFVSDLANM